MEEHLPKQVVNNTIKEDGQPKQVSTQPPNSEVGAKGGAIPKTTVDSQEGRINRVPSPSREDSGVRFDPQNFIPKVTPITENNKDRVSKAYFGLLRNEDGSVSITPQFITQCENPDIQRVNRYTEKPETFPMGILRRGHAKISDLDLHWTHVGEWAKIPINRDEKLKEGDDNYEVVRIESYIDEEGAIKKGYAILKHPQKWMYGLNMRN